MKKIIFLFAVSICLKSFSQDKGAINVFDTLCKQKFFEDHAHHDMKENYNLDKKGNLKREVSLTADALHYHKFFEDSIYHFLKRAFPSHFKSLLFYAKEDLDWKLGGGASFAWKAGKKIDHDKLQMIFSTEYEMLQKAKREPWLMKEETGHFFFHNYFLHDSITKTIFCFNNLNGLLDGQITYDSQNKITYEVAYYGDRKMFYEYRNGKLEIFSLEGKKIFERTLNEIISFDENETVVWTYAVNAKKAMGPSEQIKDFDIQKEYYDKIFALWRTNFGK